MKKPRRSPAPKKCTETRCGNTCIDTDKTCRINDPQAKKAIRLKTRALVTRLIQDSRKISETSRLGKLTDFSDILDLLSKKEKDTLINNVDSAKVIKSLLADESEKSNKRQWITEEEKQAVLNWYNNGQKSVINNQIQPQVIKQIWQEIKQTEPNLYKRLATKGSAKYRYQTEMTPEERSKFVLDMFMTTGRTCSITGKRHSFGGLEVDHKDPSKGDTPDNLILVSAAINKAKGSKTWAAFVKSLEKYDPEKKRLEAEKKAAGKAALLISYSERIKNGSIDFSSPVPDSEFNNVGRLTQLTKLLSTHPLGKYSIVTQTGKRTSVGSADTAYQLLRYRLGYIKMDEIPEAVWQELSKNSSKTREQLQAMVNLTFNPDVERTQINWKFLGSIDTL